MSFEPLKAVFDRVIADRRVAVAYSAAETCALADKIITAELPAVAGRVKATSIKNHVLQIAVTGSAVGSEVQLASATILAEIQQRFPNIQKLKVQTNYQLFAETAERGNLG